MEMTDRQESGVYLAAQLMYHERAGFTFTVSVVRRLLLSSIQSFLGVHL